MENIQVGIEALVKASSTDSWKLTFSVPSTKVRMTVDTDKDVEVGPRLAEVLLSIDRSNVYPRTIRGRELELLGLITQDSLTVKFAGDIPVYMEIAFRSYRQFLNPKTPSIKGTNTEWTVSDDWAITPNEADIFSVLATPAQNQLEGTGDFSDIYIKTGVIENTDYLIVGSNVTVVDGDTIKITILDAGFVAKQDEAIEIGNEITVRLAGINTPETESRETSQGLDRNKEYIEKYSISEDVAISVGAEAKEFTRKFVSNGGLVVIDLDASANGQLKADIYGRYIGALYQTEFTSPEEALIAGWEAPQLNKTLLSTTVDKKNTANSTIKIPLALPYTYFIENEHSRLEPEKWLYDARIKDKNKERVGDKIKAAKEKEEITTNPIEDGSTIDVKLIEGRDNSIDFLEPYDDRFENGEIEADYFDYNCRIGDVMLVVPPLSIDSNRVSNIQKVKTLRSKSSMITKGSSSVTTITLQLYFHDLDGINGKRVPASNLENWSDWGRYYYIDGLRPLIAQFKKAPFVPIDNKYINETLGIHSVALVNLNVQTVPGFPHSLAASITLAKFEHEAYMPQLPYLGSGINYPLFRWYYQEPLRDDLSSYSPYRTWLAPIPNEGLTNDIQFKVAEEEFLYERKNAIESLRKMTNPLLLEEQFENVSGKAEEEDSGYSASEFSHLGRLYKDGLAAQRVKDMYNRYLEQQSAGNIPTERGENGHVPYEKALRPNSETKKSKEAFRKIYGSKTEQEVVLASNYTPFEAYIYKGQLESFETFEPMDESLRGLIKIRLYADINISMVKGSTEVFREYEQNGLVSLTIAGNEMGLLDTVIRRGLEAEESYLNKMNDWTEAKAKVEATEGAIPLVDYTIDGTLIPTSVSVMYENQFSSAQLQSLDGPTFQFLGGQDPYIQMSFEADEDAIRSIREMLELTERYSKEYRTGITSGFLGIDNHLVNLFGVDTVMPESVNARTVPGYPGRFQVEMIFCGFNKTQKRTETLEGISPIYGEANRENRKAGNYKAEADDAIIQYKINQLELYPDLEMPTYDELISALPYLDARCNIYVNNSGGRFLDPDFYISTPETFRKWLQDQRYENHELELTDFMGVTAKTGSGYNSPLVADDEMWSILNGVTERTPSVSSDTVSWEGTVTSGNDGMTNGVEYKSEEVQKFLEDRESLITPPSIEDYAQMMNIDMNSSSLGSKYTHWKNEGMQPDEWEVYNEIYKLVDKYWVANGYVYDDTDVDYNKNEAVKKITYAGTSNLSALNYNVLIKGRMKGLNTGEKAEKDLVGLKQADYKTTNKKPTREFIANFIKAIVHSRSRWKQMSSSMQPIIDSSKNTCGIMGIPLSSEAEDLASAKKLLWDWKHNLAVGVDKLFEGYVAANNSVDINQAQNPWDWMVAGYEFGTIKFEEATIRTPFLLQVQTNFESRYNSYDQMFATPTSLFNSTILQQKNGYPSNVMALIRGDREAFIAELMLAGYRYKKKDKEDTLAYLEKKSDAEIKSIYEGYMKTSVDMPDTQDIKESTSSAYTLYGAGDGGRAGNASLDIMVEKRNKEGEERIGDTSLATYEMYKEANKYIDNTTESRLVQNSAPQDIFPDMMTDMLRYDQKMRLIRAFPTFQMFIVDEGKWMSNYRLWDNLYGFNAIQSIDVHRSRQIAADTAVIQMTNMYSNLTMRSLDTSYEEWDYKFWDNLVFGNPNEKLLESRQELQNSLLLQTGARIHLRIGYGSTADDLPVVFNGTITELDAGETVTIVAQGDGVELGNVISGDPSDDNTKWFQVQEPRDVICHLLTSKGNWFKDVINYATDGAFFKDNPLGIQHFGQPGEVVPEGTWKNLGFFEHTYGEAAQNVYSSNGIPTFSQWTYANGDKIPVSFLDTPMLDWFQPADELNIKISYYMQTVWDVIQTIAMCSTDYIAAVHPFEMRSTLFFGKPYWRLAYQYDSTYQYDAEQKSWIRNRNLEHRKPYCQFHMFSSDMDIVSNRIKASEDGVYTNVIVNYGGDNVTDVYYADWDIRFDKQKTTVVDANILARNAVIDFWTSEKQAGYYAASAVRDFMKNMYKGTIVTLGEPTLKPHDMVYMNDTMFNMNGNFLVRSVTHNFSHETGFITTTEPDALVVNDDLALLSVSNWGASLFAKAGAYVMGAKVAGRSMRKILNSSIAVKTIQLGKNGAARANMLGLSRLANQLPEDVEEVKTFKALAKELRKLDLNDEGRAEIVKKMEDLADSLDAKVKDWEKEGKFLNEDGKKIKGSGSLGRVKRSASTMKMGVKAVTDGAKAYKYLKYAGIAVSAVNPLTLIASIASTWAVEHIAEKYRRKKASRQCVVMMPLMYQGRQYTAGINGHKGMVVGDARMGKLDSFMSGMGLDGVNGNEGFEWVMDTWNWLMDAEGKDYLTTQEDLMNMSLQTSDTSKRGTSGFLSE